MMREEAGADIVLGLDHLRFPESRPAHFLGTLRTMGRLVRRTLNGDEPLAEWSASDRSSYDAAVAVFERELGAGYAASRADGPRYEGVTELPRDAELVILETARGGG